MPPPSRDDCQLRRADNNERFVAFAFAAADLVVEIEPDGQITYAAGAFQTKLGLQPEAFIGRSIRELVTFADHATLDAALSFLVERGRLMPLMIRLADPRKTELALAGLVLTATNSATRLCLTFAAPPLPMQASHIETPRALVRAAETRLRTGASTDVGLLEVTMVGSDLPAGLAIGSTLQTLVPDAITSEISPGRFGLLGEGSGAMDLVAIAASLEGALHAQGMEVAVASHHLCLGDDGLTPNQAARALRQALTVFARGGTAASRKADMSGGLAGYMREATTHTRTLRRAIQDLHFELAFQPIVDLRDRKLHHYEALIRPRPMAGCPVSTPQDFVVLAEALGLADELDLAVAGLASMAAAASPVPIAFNVSGQSVQNAVFRDRLLALLGSSTACRAGRLVVEMTETAEVENLIEAAQTAEMLRAIGIPFCLDDFGAGSADVRILRGVPADIVKLDGSYVSGITENGRDHAFVAGMIGMAAAAGAKVIAEKVEREDQAEALSALGVSYGQGWLFGRPAPLPELWPKLNNANAGEERGPT